MKLKKINWPMLIRKLEKLLGKVKNMLKLGSIIKLCGKLMFKMFMRFWELI